MVSSESVQSSAQTEANYSTVGGMSMKLDFERLDQARRTGGEHWKPISCSDLSPIRRFFDLQAGTVWRDLARVLPHLRGCLVDVGCGAQPYRTLLPPGVAYIGIDTYDAKAVFGYETPNTRYYDGVTWPLEDGSVDSVLATETLEHVRDPAQFLSEAFRVLRSDGKLILTVPFSARWHYIPEDYWRFTPSGLLQLLREARFADIRIFARGNSVTVAAYKCIALLTRFVLPQAKDPTTAFVLRLFGLVIAPLFVALAIVGNLSLFAKTDDDCLGYTVVASKLIEAPNS
jgi:SAM-dependent methyltransferase